MAVFEREIKQGIQSPIGINSSTTPLNNGQTFSGVLEISDFPEMVVSCFTDQQITLYLDFSVDGTEDSITTFPVNGVVVPAGSHTFYPAVKAARYVRVRVANNSGANQSTFRLYTYYGYLRDSEVFYEFYDEILDTSVQNTLPYGFGRVPIRYAQYDQFEVTATSDTAASFGGGTAYYTNVRY